jgi:hypothetical protein
VLVLIAHLHWLILGASTRLCVQSEVVSVYLIVLTGRLSGVGVLFIDHTFEARPGVSPASLLACSNQHVCAHLSLPANLYSL